MNCSVTCARSFLNNNRIGLNIARTCSGGSSKKSSGSSPKSSGGTKVSTAKTTGSISNPLSSKTVGSPAVFLYNSAATPVPPSQPVGPGALKTGDYKNAEYFCYNDLSYYDFETEMDKDRMPQPKSGNEMF